MNRCRGAFIALACWFSSLTFAEMVWIDVRTSAERILAKIDGDIHIPHRQIVSGVEKLELSKDAEIAIYCALGGRAERAKNALLEAGYINVTNIGGLADAKALKGID